MNAASEKNPATFLRNSTVATVISLLAVSAYGIYAFVEKLSMGGAYLLTLLPLTLHAIALFLLLKQPGASSISATIWIGWLGFIISLVLVPIGVLTLAFHGTSLLLLLNLVYFTCQLTSIVQGTSWKNTAQKS